MNPRLRKIEEDVFGRELPLDIVEEVPRESI